MSEVQATPTTNPIPNYLIRMSHRNGKLTEVQIHANQDQIKRILQGLHQNQPSDYGRLMHYGQCRYLSRVLAHVRVYWFTMNELDWEVIGILITKELEANAVSRT